MSNDQFLMLWDVRFKPFKQRFRPAVLVLFIEVIFIDEACLHPDARLFDSCPDAAIKRATGNFQLVELAKSLSRECHNSCRFQA